jgi:hypothetical protein
VSPDSFLIDPFLLFADGLVLALLWERVWRGRYSRALPLGVAALILVVFYSVSISLFFDLAWVDGFARACGAATGRDWMLNSGVFHFDYAAPPSTGVKLFAAACFASYIGWLALGAQVGSRIWARPATGP